MKVQYQKGKNKRFMILDGNNYPENFETEMMKENNISALLPFYTVEKNGRCSIVNNLDTICNEKFSGTKYYAI